MIRLALCDDHALVRAGLVQILATRKDFQIVGEAADGPALITLLRGQAVDVALLDIALPGRDGLEVLQQMRLEWPLLPVLVLSTYPEKQYALRCLRLGAGGYLNKSVDPDTLAGAIRKLHAGGSYVSAALAETLATALRRHDERAAHELLSAREYQVFLQIAGGRSAAQIATQLHLSPNTVNTYRARIMDKIGTRNDVETALYAVRHQIVSGAAEASGV